MSPPEKIFAKINTISLISLHFYTHVRMLHTMPKIANNKKVIFKGLLGIFIISKIRGGPL